MEAVFRLIKRVYFFLTYPVHDPMLAEAFLQEVSSFSEGKENKSF